MCCLFKHALVARCASPVLAFVSFFAYADPVGSGCAGMVEEEVPRLVDHEGLPIMLPHARLHTRHRIRYRMRYRIRYYMRAYAMLKVLLPQASAHSLLVLRARIHTKNKKVRGPGLRRPD